MTSDSQRHPTPVAVATRPSPQDILGVLKVEYRTDDLGCELDALGCPNTRTPLSASLMGSDGIQSITVGTRLAAEAAGQMMGFII